MAAVGETNLLERESELSLLRATIGGVQAGRGRVIMVEGGAGAGKSALLQAASERAAEDGLRVLAASGSEFEREFAFGAVRRLFEPVLGTVRAVDRRRLLAGAAGPAEWVIAPAVEGDGPRDRVDAGFAVMHAIYWLATNVAVEAPLVIAVDDLHWVDESSLRSLDYLARRIADVPIALVVALRPDEPGAPAELIDDLRGLPDVLAVQPRSLTPASVAALVRAQAPAASAAVCAAFHAASAGNPLYVRELLRTFAVDGVLARADAADRVRAVSVPSLGERVMRRIARVDPAARALATAMAVLGDGGSLTVAARLAGLADDDAAGLARRLLRIEVLASEDPFAFVHPLVRRSIYDEQSVAERDAAHNVAAGLLREAGASHEAVAVHLAAVRPSASTIVASALSDAAHEAMARAAPGTAMRWLSRALDEGAAEPARAALLYELGKVELASRDPASVRHLEEALSLSADPVRRAWIALGLGEILVTAGQWAPAVSLVTAAIDELGDREPEVSLELEVYRAVTRAFDPQTVADFDADRERLEKLARGDSWAALALSVVLATVAAARGQGVDEVMALVEHGVGGGRLFAERGAGGWAAAQAANPLVMVDANERALEVLDDLAAAARRSGALIGSLTATGYRGWVHARRGNLVAAEAELRTPAEVGTQNGMHLVTVTAMQFLEDAMIERSTLDDFVRGIESIELEPAFLGSLGGAMLLEARGRQRLRRGERSGAAADLRGCGAVLGKLRWGPRYAPWRSWLALALPREDREEALALVDEDLALASGLHRAEGVVLRAAGVLYGGDRGLSLLHDSVAVLDDSPARLELARSLVELGAALRRHGQRTAARERLHAGMELAHRCGAERLIARADEELHLAGARPRRIARTGIEALTASEQRIARLAAQGRSNAEVAQELFVSLKTVETHLTHVYSKLGLSGSGARRRLAAALERSAAG